MINLNRLTLARAMEKVPVKFKPLIAAQEFKEYHAMWGKCPNPPPCLGCPLELWYFCSESGYTCGKFLAYEDDPKAEKDELPEEEEG
jgi:hypothetical protein